MEDKSEWYRKLLRKLNNIKAGQLDLDEYIEEVKGKITADKVELGPKCLCFFETDRFNCQKECPKKPTIVQS